MWCVLKIVLFSIIIIYIVHYSLDYVKNTYTVQKTKDIVGFQTQKYKAIVQEMLENSAYKEQCSQPIPDFFIKEEEKQNMENDLAQFMQEQMSK